MVRKKSKETKHTYKDNIFRILFDDEEKVLALYNALTGKEYPENTDVQIVTLDDAIFNGNKNDLAFLIDHRFISLVEHQSTLTPNMPLRFLEYIAKEYQTLYFSKAIYSKTRIKLPTPEFYVLYNGKSDAPLEQTLKLSDAFLGECDTINLEVVVRIINVNYEKGAEILKHCKTLRDYSLFIYKVRSYYRDLDDVDVAIKRSIDECIKEGVLVDFLKKNRGEIMSFLHVQLSQEEREEIRENDGYLRGREDGYISGKEDGYISGKEDGYISGKEDLAREIAVKMKRSGMPKEQIIQLTGLDARKIEKL